VLFAVGTKTYVPFVHEGKPEKPVASEGQVGSPELDACVGDGDIVGGGGAGVGAGAGGTLGADVIEPRPSLVGGKEVWLAVLRLVAPAPRAV